MSVSLVRGKFEGIRENLIHKNLAIDDPNNPGNCCFKDESNPNQCLCNGNYTDNPNKSKTTMNFVDIVNQERYLPIHCAKYESKITDQLL